VLEALSHEGGLARPDRKRQSCRAVHIAGREPLAAFPANCARRATGSAGAAGAESKWGRHRCRPHSHRHVVAAFFMRRARRTVATHMSGSALGARCLGSWRLHPKALPDPEASSPALAPASGLVAFPEGRFGPRGPFTEPAGCVPGRDRGSPMADQSDQVRGRSLLPAALADRYRGLHANETFAPSFGKAACNRPEPPACRLSNGAWTVANAVPGLKNLELSGLCSLGFPWFLVPKTA